MNYKEINKDNIEEIKYMYERYLQKCVLKHYSNYQPLSFGDFIENELTICSGCGYVNLEDDMIDTTGMVNGGVGYLCEDCVGDME